MPIRLHRDIETPYGLLALMAVQVVCAVFFLSDVIDDFREVGAMAVERVHLYFELAATISLFAAIVLESRYFLAFLRRQAKLEESATIASAAVQDVIYAHFDAWKLTPAERDIANFLVKGSSIAEIAALRGSAEGTIKSHLNAIYRKSGANGRGELMAEILDSLMAAPPKA